jgi:hypothetical protein
MGFTGKNVSFEPKKWGSKQQDVMGIAQQKISALTLMTSR